MPLLFVSTNIRESDSFTHFSWDDIISFSEVDRSMLSYRTGGSEIGKLKVILEMGI